MIIKIQFKSVGTIKIVATLILLISLQACQNQTSEKGETLPVSALKTYVNESSTDFSFEIKDTISHPKAKVFHIKMNSGRWLSEKEVNNPLWWHWVDIVVPETKDTETALMFIGGGSLYDNQVFLDSTTIAQAINTKSIIAHISNVPFQPLSFKGTDSIQRYEDNIIAYGWDKFLKGGAKEEDVEWLAHYPMTRAVVRAMDVVEEVSQNVGASVSSFFVSGASKRGWTTWTTAAVDDRVMGIAPLVIDMLNINPSFDHHYKVYGDWSPAVQDYTNNAIMDWMGSQEFNRMMDFIEPYQFKALFTMPKLIVNGTIDEFFVTDSWKYYWDDLPEKKYLQYVPNGNHGLAGRYSTQNIFSFYDTLIHQKQLPEMEWRIEEDQIVVEVKSNMPYEIALWQANNPMTRDFRIWAVGKSWQKKTLPINPAGQYAIKIPIQEKGFTASLVEVIFNPSSPTPLILTTGTTIKPDQYPFESYQPKQPLGTYSQN